MSKVNSIWVLLLFICLLSCKRTTDNKENLENNNEEVVKEKNNFPVVKAECFGFVEDSKYISIYNGKGPIIRFGLTYKNNSDNKITDFDLIYYIKATYQDGKVKYFPKVPFDDENNDEKRFTSIANQTASLKKDEIWLPNTEKEFKIDIFGGLGPGWTDKNNFYVGEFKRTPTELILLTRYKAIGVDGEYTLTTSDDILSFWKDYQKEIGLR